VRPVKTMRLDAAAEGGRRIFPGTVQAARRAQLSFRVSGPLVQLPVKQGQEVRQGDLLAQVDRRDFRTALANLEARLADLRAQLKAMQVARPEDIRALEANLTAAQARRLEAQATFRRYQRLYENDNVAKAEYDQRRAAREVAGAEVRRAEENLNVARSGARPEDIEAMQARIRAMQAELGQARDRLKDTSLLAPFDGRVAETYVENFEYVQARQPILSLQDVSTVEIVAQLPESIVAQARRGAFLGFKARFQSLPGKEFDARAFEFTTQADPVTRTYSVTFQTPQPEEGNIFAGMTAEIVLQQRGGEQTAIAVPVSAIFADETGAHHVWVLDQASMTARKTPVQVGEMSGESAQVLAGLQTGSIIITAGTHSITEGQKLRPITDELRERR
ncbi:MAG: efflux RND transporter periplasmic adaptor subunit, partial [Acidobacteriota bacterium]